MKRETIKFKLPHKAPRAFMLFCEDTPYRHKEERLRKKYNRKRKYQKEDEY